MTVWGLFLTAVLNLAFVPVIAVGLIMLLFDRTFGTHFFTGVAINPAQAGQPLLYQHIFWAFGHPEVYILILPIWGVVSDVLSVFSRKPAFGYRLTALSMFVITCLSTVVWGHHMFISGMSPAMGKAFQSLTMLISIPSSIFFFNWLATLWRGNLKFTTPMLFAIGVIFRVRHRRANRYSFGVPNHGYLFPWHLFRGGAFPLHHGHVGLPGIILCDLFLVPQNVRSDDERNPWQDPFLDHLLSR